MTEHAPPSLRTRAAWSAAGVLALTTLVVTAVAGPAAAAPGDPDPTFGTGGRVVVDDTVTNSAYGVAVQPDGKIVVVGYSRKDSSVDTLVFRLNPDGSQDTSFGPQRLAVPGGGEDYATAVAIAPDGGIVIAGLTDTQDDAVIWRLLPSGDPDSGFGGGDGLLTVDNGAREFFTDVAVAPDGAIVAVGQTHGSTSGQAAIYRFTPAGDPDDTFDTDGKLGIGSSFARADGVAVQPDGKILLTGYFGAPGAYGLQVRRLEADGDPDQGFGDGDGEAAASGLSASGRDLLLQADGSVVVTGTHNQSDGTTTGAVVRYTATGRVDTAFNGSTDRDGRLLVAGEGLGTSGLAIAALPSGGYVVTGHWLKSVKDSAGVVFRLGADGAVDPAFGTGGRVELGGGTQAGLDVAVQPDGRALVAGHTGASAVVHRLLMAEDPVMPTPTTTPTPQPTTPATPTCHGKVATIVGTAGSDRLRGTPRADVIVALGGRDVVRGLGGRDTVCAGDGADRVLGGAGSDHLRGERGGDRLLGGAGKDRLVGGPGRDVTEQQS